MNNELERIWKEAAVAQSRCYPGICLERRKRAKKKLESGYQVSQLRFEPSTPSEYKSRAVVFNVGYAKTS
jgi:hypothetical protein